MANKHASLDALFADIADAIREKTGDSGTIPAVEFPNMIRNKLEVIPPPNPYLTFSSPSSFTLAVLDGMKLWDGKMEFSTDTETWTEWNGEEISSEVSGDSNNLYLRGIGNTIILGDDGAEYYWVLTGSGIKCIGNIENLLDYITVASGNHPTMADRCYYNMFSNCTGLTQAPDLPATTLTEGCYSGMFAGCTGLTQAPALPATTLAEGCYSGIFGGCTSLTQAPALPATTLANYCYYFMFRDCTGLTQAPSLPVTTLVSNCYQSMFSGCTGLTQAPALPATRLAVSCYDNMFSNCTGLTQAPDLPVTNLGSYCYRGMFSGCTALTQAPALPATTLAEGCYDGMFSGCTRLIQASALPATTLANGCYDNMFSNCTSLTQAPALPATTLTVYCYQYMFRGCTKIKLSSTRTGEYTQEYRIPSSGTGTTATNALSNMFTSTGGTFTGTPKINTTYYLSNTNTVVG